MKRHLRVLRWHDIVLILAFVCVVLAAICWSMEVGP